ncbi:MAG: oxalate/formate MFS antiporter [Pseudomonadota bacterium]
MIRTCVDRLAGDGDHTIADEMGEVAVKGLHRIQVRDNDGDPDEAIIEIRYRKIRVLPPIGKQKRYPALILTVIHAEERGTPNNRKKIEWKLITDLPVNSRADAIEKLEWYALRWKIEVFHKIGLTAAGFGAGAAATVVPIRDFIASYGYEAAFLWFGLGQGAVILILANFLRAPAAGQIPVPSTKLRQSARNFSLGEMLGTPLFWVLYVMFVLVAAGGLMATAQLASIAIDFGVANTPLTVLGITGTTLSIALVVDNVLNGLARPFFGWISDQIGREITMFIVFSAGAASMWALSAFGQSPLMFVLLGGAIYFTWGEIYSLFPSTCTDAFGSKYAATNAGMLYTAKGTAALLVPLASWVVSMTGNWQAVFTIAAGMDVVAAVMAIALLKPMRASHHAALASAAAPPIAKLS